jgi:hypothetical protein
MGAIGNAVTGMLQRAKQDANFRRDLEGNPRRVLEREIGRKLTEEELQAALAELKRNGINAKAGDS